jgi:hypothetical protein
MDPQFDLQGGRARTLVVFDAPPLFADVCYDWYGFYYVNSCWSEFSKKILI